MGASVLSRGFRPPMRGRQLDHHPYRPTRSLAASGLALFHAATVRRTLSQLVQINARVRWWLGLPGVAARV